MRMAEVEVGEVYLAKRSSSVLGLHGKVRALEIDVMQTVGMSARQATVRVELLEPMLVPLTAGVTRKVGEEHLILPSLLDPWVEETMATEQLERVADVLRIQKIALGLRDRGVVPEMLTMASGVKLTIAEIEAVLNG